MSLSANIGNTDGLRQLDIDLVRFVGRVMPLLDRLRAEVRSARELLERRRADAQNAVDHWSGALETSGDDDSSQIEARLCDSEERLSEVESDIAQAEAHQGSYERALADLHAMIVVGIPKGRVFLQEKHAQLTEYIAVGCAGEGHVAAGKDAVGIANASGEAELGTKATPEAVGVPVGVPRLADLTNYKLPDGFRWFELDRIALREMAELPLADDYPKVSYEDMKAGFEVLRTEILPALQVRPPAIVADRCAKLDLTTPLRSGIRRYSIWSAFFGRQFGEYVRIEGFRGEFTITSGRHRVAVARDLGWTAIPAEVVEVG